MLSFRALGQKREGLLLGLNRGFGDQAVAYCGCEQNSDVAQSGPTPCRESLRSRQTPVPQAALGLRSSRPSPALYVLLISLKEVLLLLLLLRKAEDLLLSGVCKAGGGG